MKIRTVILLVGLFLIASFAAINMNEILRTTTINLGLSQIEAPLGLILLGVLSAALCFFLVVILLLQTGHLFAMRQVHKEAEDQRDLANSAEQSRFTQLQQQIREQESNQQQREESKYQDQLVRLAELETNLRTQVEEYYNALAASIGEMEDRVERQVKNLI